MLPFGFPVAEKLGNAGTAHQASFMA